MIVLLFILFMLLARVRVKDLLIFLRVKFFTDISVYCDNDDDDDDDD